MLLNRKRDRSITNSTNSKNSSPNSTEKKKKKIVSKNKNKNILFRIRDRELYGTKINSVIENILNKTLYQTGLNLEYVLTYNPQIPLYFFDVDEKFKISIKKYVGIDYDPETNRGQIELIPDDDDTDEIRENPHLDTVSIRGKEYNDGKYGHIIINDIQFHNLYVDSEFLNLYLFRVNKYIQQEKKNFYKKMYNIRFIDIPSTGYDDLDTEYYKFFEKYRILEPINERIKTPSPSPSPISYGGNNKILKYKKLLEGKTLEKIQNIAKNKKINYTRKYNGKYVNISKKTLIKKLCKYKFDN